MDESYKGRNGCVEFYPIAAIHMHTFTYLVFIPKDMEVVFDNTAVIAGDMTDGSVVLGQQNTGSMIMTQPTTDDRIVCAYPF